MPNTTNGTLWLIAVWCALACINTSNKRIWQAQDKGRLPEGDNVPPSVLGWLAVPQYAALVLIGIINWRLAVVLYVVTFAAAIALSPVLEVLGAILQIPIVYVLKRVSIKR